MAYDPVKAHEYYIKNRDLKGRKKGQKEGPSGGRQGGTGAAGRTQRPGKPATTKSERSSSTSDTSDGAARVSRLKEKVSTLEGALSKAQAALSEKRQAAREEEKKSSDMKTTAKERQAAKEYREKHKAEIEAKRKKESGKDSDSDSDSGGTSLSDMSIEDLESRVSNIKDAISEAKQQLSDAQQQLGHMAHSALTSEPTFNERFGSTPISRKDSVEMTADFSGWATRNDLRCSDGRTILADAFKDNDGQIVPLVWQHGHDDVNNVLGHVKLENRPEGVYAHAFFNSTVQGQNAKEMVKHGDIRLLSIYANKLVEKIRDKISNYKDVVKGNIREVSLVLAGANPGAVIDNVNIVHGDGDFTVLTEEAVITTGLELELSHAETDTVEEDTETAQDILDTLNEKQRNAVYYLLSQALTVESNVKHSDTDSDEVAGADNEADDGNGDDGEDTESESESSDESEADNDSETEADESASDESESAVDTDEAGDAVQHDITNQEDNSMTHNVFDQAKEQTTSTHHQVSLSHADVEGIVAAAVKGGSLKDAVEDYALQHGIENIDYLFPDAKLLENSPAFISRRMEWVDKVLSSVRKSPFSRIKTITADITPDEARARGYIKGNMKNEEYFALAKRETTPQTIYKKQKLDRDDVVDIVDLDVVAWLKAEMKVMLDEELAGAILVGDGRSAGDDDKIKEINIRPIATDAELYVTTVNVNLADASSSVEELVDAAINARKFYKGTGQPTFYTTENYISRFLTVKDNFGRRLYANLSDVASVLRVSDIVPVEVMERDDDLVGIMVNLADYTLGADRGGQATMFDDFDIDYNKLRYLIETRCSGALTQPKSALVFRARGASEAELPNPTEPSFDGTVVTVPTVTNVTYKDESDGSTLTTGSPVTLASGESLHVKAYPAAGKYFATDAEDEWTYTNEG